MTQIPTLTTERLLLRPFRHEDVDAFADLCADDEVMRWLGGTMDRADAWRHMAAITGHWRLRGFGRWAVELRETGELAGHAGIWFPEGWPAIEIGWTLARSFWGRGLATEAARAALRYAHDELEMENIVSLIEPANERSQRVAAKLGLSPSDDRFTYRGHNLVVWRGPTGP